MRKIIRPNQAKELVRQRSVIAIPSPFFLARNKQNLVCTVEALVKEMQKDNWIYFQFHYCDPEDRDFSELGELHAVIEDAAGRAGIYKGCLCLELSKWLEHEKEEYFDVLMCYLHDRSDDIFPFFYVANEDEYPDETIEALYRKVAGYFRVEWVEIINSKVRDYVVYVKEQLMENWLFLNEGSEACMEEILEAVQESSDFMGTITLDNLCEDMMAYAERKGVRKNLTEDFMNQYVTDSDYLECFMKKDRKEQGIGLIPNRR